MLEPSHLAGVATMSAADGGDSQWLLVSDRVVLRGLWVWMVKLDTIDGRQSHCVRISSGSHDGAAANLAASVDQVAQQRWDERREEGDGNVPVDGMVYLQRRSCAPLQPTWLLEAAPELWPLLNESNTVEKRLKSVWSLFVWLLFGTVVD